MRLLLSSKVPEERTAAQGMGRTWLWDLGGELCAEGTKEERRVLEGEVLCGKGRAWDPTAILFISFHNRAVLLQVKALCVSQIWPAGNWGGRWANRERCFPQPESSTPTTPGQQRLIILYAHDIVWYCATLCRAGVARVSHGAAQLYSVVTGRSTENPGSPGRLSTSEAFLTNCWWL